MTSPPLVLGILTLIACAVDAWIESFMPSGLVLAPASLCVVMSLRCAYLL